MASHIAYSPLSGVLQRSAWRPGRLTMVRALAVAVVTLAALVGWWLTSTTVIDLSRSGSAWSGLQQQWQQGRVVVMIRHAERCDRSAGACLGPLDGITINGQYAAQAVGAGLQALGLDHARLLASPMTRTRQTADLIGGRHVAAQVWVGKCESDFKDAVLGHKKAHENLVLMTHSGCIDQFERKMGVRADQRSSDYAQAVFVQVDGVHAPSILGELDAAQWARVTGGSIN
ncbi:lipopolysaccharide core heptose(II)-phosphate phosphatase PmrG [Pseudomonas syringae]